MTEEQRRRKAAQARNAQRVKSGQPTPRVSGLSPDAIRAARERAAKRSEAKERGTPPPAPVRPSRVPISPGQIGRDRDALRRRLGGFEDNGEWTEPRLTERGGSLPRSDFEYEVDDSRGVVYDKQGIFPKYNYNRERMEAKRFNRQDADQGDFIPLTYAPTKTSWPGNEFDHRRTVAAGYSRTRGIIRVQFFTDGSVYDYGTATPIPPKVAYQFRLTQSPGRAIHAGPGWSGDALEQYGYERVT